MRRVTLFGAGRPDQASRLTPAEWNREQSGYYRVVRAGDWKLQFNGRQQKTWLFDLAADPTEQTNLAAARPDKVESLMALLDAYQVGARKPLYPHTLETPIAIDKTRAEHMEPGDEYIYWPN